MSVTVSKVYVKTEGKIFQDKKQVCRHITEHYDLLKIEITIKV
jgi:hypothetical protein